MKKIVFTKQENGKYRFSVDGDANATAFLIKNTINHSVKEKGLSFAKKALEKLLIKYDSNVDYTIEEESAMVKLNDYSFSVFRTGLEVEVKTHLADRIEAVITLIDGNVFQGLGTNQRLARQNAALEACRFYRINIE